MNANNYIDLAKFIARFSNAYWKVDEYRFVEDKHIELSFFMTAIDAASGECVKWQGLEKIHFTSDDLIRHVTVRKPNE